jgi:CRP/FNR family transcriptional regulator, cyclic AMP receptor protein
MPGLERVSIFAKLSKAHLERLGKLAKRETYAKDTAIFFQDDRSGALYVVISGALKVYQTSEDGRERVLNTLGPGEIFGELGLLDESPRSATVTTLEPTEVLAITSKDVRAVVKEEPEVLWKIVEALCERIRELTTEALDMSFRSVPYRVLRMLIQATTKHGQPTDAGTRVTIDAKHLASQVNCGVDQATSILGRFAERGLLLVMEGHLLVPDPKALTRALEYEDL